MTDIRSSAPDFTCNGITFRCWITDAGGRYEWRSLDGRLFVGRNVGSGTCWARAGRQRVGTAYRDLKTAMQAATLARWRAAA